MTLQTALQQACKLLEEESVAAPRLTAEVLLCHALSRERSYLYSHPEAELSDLARLHYGRYLHERLAGKPTQYITGVQEFYGRDFLVTPEVLIPRPETEHVVEGALALSPPPRRMVDVGCGSGAIAVTLSLELHAEVAATDISIAALAVAAKNAKMLNARVEFVACDLASAFAPASLDLVVSNPPYVALRDAPGLQREVRDYEPHVALFAGRDRPGDLRPTGEGSRTSVAARRRAGHGTGIQDQRSRARHARPAVAGCADPPRPGRHPTRPLREAAGSVARG